MAIKVLLDANVILDYVLKRDGYETIRELFVLAQRYKVKLFVSTSIAHIVSYWLTKYQGSVRAKEIMLVLFSVIKIIDGDHGTVVLALQSPLADIEDAIQYHIAIKNKMEYILTNDQHFQQVALPALSVVGVAEFLKNNA